MVLLLSAGIPHASSQSAIGWGVSSAFRTGLSYRFWSWLVPGWSRMATEGTSDGPETHLGSPSQSLILQQASPGLFTWHTRTPKEGVELNKISLDLGSEPEHHCIHRILVAK